MPFALRAARPDDAPVIVDLIKELANYEKLADEAHPDAEMLAEQLRRRARPRVEAILAVDTESGDAIGFALFFQNYSTFLTRWGLYLEDLYVRPAFRDRGVGFALLRAVAQVALDRECVRLEWSVLNWNDLANRFYKKLRADPLREWTTMRLSGAALREVAGVTGNDHSVSSPVTSEQSDPVV